MLLRLSHHFGLRHFVNICVKLIESNLTMANICDIYDKIYLYDIPLTKKCLKFILEQIPEVLEDGSLMQIQDVALNTILAENDDALSPICESDILKPMIDWADKQCSQRKLLPTPANRRSVLKDRIFLIRFGAMDLEVFGKCLSFVQNGFFTNNELCDILQCIALGANYSKTRIAKPFRCDRRMLRVEIKKSVSTRSIHYYYETIYKKKNITSVLGFMTKFVVTEIINPSNSHKLDFVLTCDRVMFAKPLEFSSGQCSFKVKGPEIDTSGSEVYHVDSEGKADVYIRCGRITCISTLFYC